MYMYIFLCVFRDAIVKTPTYKIPNYAHRALGQEKVVKRAQGLPQRPCLEESLGG